MSMNKVLLIGHLGQDVELKYTSNGKAVASISLATNESWKDNEGVTQKKTDWHRIVVWGKQAENCSKYLSKGRQICVEGRLQTRSWDQEGSKRYITEVVAQRVEFLQGSSHASENISQTASYSENVNQVVMSDEDIPF